MVDMACLHLSESTVQIELPPIKVIGMEREVIIFSTVAGVGQNIPATFGKAQKYVSETKYRCTLRLSNQVPLKVDEQKCATDPALRNSSLTMFFKGTQIRRGNFLNRRCGNCPNSCTTHKSGYQYQYQYQHQHKGGGQPKTVHGGGWRGDAQNVRIWNTDYQ